MKQYLIKGFAAAGVVLLTVPAFAQKEKEKEKDKEAKERQTIVINRTGDSEEETVIRIKGDKVTVNGKDAKESKDVNVNVHKYKDFSALSPTIAHGGTWNMVNDGNFSIFSEDANRAMLGVVTDEHEKGAAITSITKESAAEKAGLQKGDVITKIGDKKIADSDDVSAVVRSHKPGDKVAITFLRDGKEQKVTTELSKWKGVSVNTDAIASLPRVPQTPRSGTTFYSSSKPKMGISIQDTEDGKGVKILEVENDGAAAKAGLKKDDVITHVDDNEVNSTDEVKRATNKSSQYNYNFKVLRNGKAQTVEVKLQRPLKKADL
jgi:serine protease Do